MSRAHPGPWLVSVPSAATQRPVHPGPALRGARWWVGHCPVLWQGARHLVACPLWGEYRVGGGHVACPLAAGQVDLRPRSLTGHLRGTGNPVLGAISLGCT